MPTLRSKSLSTFGHPDFVVDVTSAHEPEGRSLIAYLEESVENGERFNESETINIGCGVLKFFANENGDLFVCEPSFDEMPIRWVNGANRTYAHLMLQRQVCSELGIDPDFSSMLHAGVISEYMLSHLCEFQMDRHSGNGQGNSGWALYESGKTDAEGIKWVSLFEISTIYPQVIPFLGLPQNTSVAYQKDIIEVSCDGKVIDSNSNDFLHQLLTSKNYGSMRFPKK